MKMIEVEYWNGKPCWAEVTIDGTAYPVLVAVPMVLGGEA